MLPPGPTRTLARGEVVVTTSPRSLVEVTIAAATRVEVVNVLPWALVVVSGTSTLSLAEVMNADVVTATTLPPDCVEETTIGTRTPVSVVAEDPPVTTLLVIAGGVLTTVLPASFVVVTGGG